mgnify:CR=1 FL=1
MKYFEVDFTIETPQVMMQDARDIVAALAGEAGFETFEDTDKGIKGYVQQTEYNEQVLRALLDGCPLPSCTISFTTKEAEDKDWNEQWEQEGFEPIIVEGQGTRSKEQENKPANTIIIHDGRHLPQDYPLINHISIEIDAHLAFGTGTHETTRMMVSQLMELDLEGKRVLDCGTGTGILGIAALKLGASDAVGYDIDEWSADNARHNAVINRVDSQFTSLLGDASILKEVEGVFDVVLANINRNILLNDMEAFAGKMPPYSTLLLSGFYTQDIDLLEQKASTLGLTKKAQRHDGDWDL